MTEPPLPPPIPALPAEGNAVTTDQITGMVPSTVYQGFSVAETFTLPDSYIFSSTADTDTISLTINDDYIYRYAFISLDGSSWKTVSLTGTLSDHYITGSAAASIPINPNNFSLTTPGQTVTRNYIVTYTCDSSFQCHDGWQIGQFNASLEEETPSWQEGLLAWWKLDGDATDSAGTHDGTVRGAVPSTSGCISRGCYSFDGDDKIDVGVIPVPGNKGSMSLWLKADFVDDRWKCAMGRFWTQHKIGKNGDSIYFTGSWETEGETWGGIESDVPLDNEWHHIVLTYDGDLGSGNLKMYVDGSLSSSKDLSGNTDNNGESWQIGAHGDNSQYWSGSIDEVMIHDRPLSASEVASMYAFFTVEPCGSDPDCPADYEGSAYCSGDDVYRDDHDWSCTRGMCTEAVSSVLVEDCQDGYTCFSGECREGPGEIFNIYFEQDFEESSLGPFAYPLEPIPEFNGGKIYYTSFDPENLTIEEENGNKILMNHLPAGSFELWSGSGFDITVPLENQSQEELYVSLKMKFSENIASEYTTHSDGSRDHYLAGKFPASFISTNGWDATPGTKPGPDEGYDTLMAFHSDTPDEPDKLGIFFYVYHENMYCTNNCDDGDPDNDIYYASWLDISYRLEPERWYTVTQRMAMNDPPWASNGTLEYFVDGQLVASYSFLNYNLKFRETYARKIENINLCNFFGGSGYPPKEDAWWVFDDIVVFNYKDGVDVPRENTPSPPGRIIEVPSI